MAGRRVRLPNRDLIVSSNIRNYYDLIAKHSVDANDIRHASASIWGKTVVRFDSSRVHECIIRKLEVQNILSQ